MVQTCANPACAIPFRYWRGGKLFRCDLKTPGEPGRDVSDQICQLKPTRSSVFFWLCENCCSTMALSFDPHTGLTIVRRSSANRQRHGTDITEPQELRAWSGREQSAAYLEDYGTELRVCDEETCV
jgi:hypothetical protein